MNEIPCLPSNININRYNGAACWNAGWGTDEVDGQVEFLVFSFNDEFANHFIY